MTETTLYGCELVASLYGVDYSCCSSCHEDVELGYYSWMVSVPDPRNHDGDELECCCAISNQITDREQAEQRLAALRALESADAP